MTGGRRCVLPLFVEICLDSHSRKGYDIPIESIPVKESKPALFGVLSDSIAEIFPASPVIPYIMRRKENEHC